MRRHEHSDAIKHVVKTEIGPLVVRFWDKDVALVLSTEGVDNEVNGVSMYIRMDMRSYDDGRTFVQQCHETHNLVSNSQIRINYNALRLSRRDHKDASDAARRKVTKIILDVVAELLKQNPNIRMAAAALGKNNDLARLENDLEKSEKVVADIQQQINERNDKPFLEY